MAKSDKSSVWDRNYAEDKALAERVAGYFVPRIRVVRNNRLALEEAWWRFFNMWSVTKDGYHGYQGRAQLYIPEVRKNVEAQARQMTKSAFPSEDCFDVSPGLTGTARGARSWLALHQWAMRNTQLQTKYFVAMRQLAMLGTCPIYLPWRKETRHEFRSRKIPGQKKIAPQRQEIELFNGPDFIVRDIFRWYTFNPKISDLSDGCFEINALSPFQLLALMKAGDLANYEDIRAGTANAYLMEEFARDVMRAESQGIQLQYNTASAGQAVINRDGTEDPYADLTYMQATIYADMIFPEACEDGEDPEKPIAMKVQLYGNSLCGLIQRNPFYHQRPPYVVGKYIQPNADEFYGQGIPWAIQYMQYEINTKAEQGMDSATLALNPLAIVDPGLAGASNEFNVEPGAIWWANPAGVKLASLPDVSPIAYQAISQLRAQMQDYSDRSPALPPQLLGKSRTATQSEIVFDTLGVDNWLFEIQNENQILTPMLSQWESLTDQNMDDEMLVMVLGRKAGDLKRTLLAREDLIGRYAYEWKGATATANKQVISRQMLDALKVIVTMPPQMMQGLNFNAAEFIKVMWNDMWQLKDGDRILGIPEEMMSQDAAAENKMAEMGLELEVLPMDDDAGHMASHEEAIQSAKSEMVKSALVAHNLLHDKQAKAKQQMQQQMQQQQQFQMHLMLLQAQSGNKGRSKSQGPGSGNRTQMSPNLNSGDQGSGTRS